MIDAVISIAPAPDLLALDLWDGDLPDLSGVRALKVEPKRWWLVDAGRAIDQIAAQIGHNGAITAFGGGFVRATIGGPGWRDLLSVSGLIDVERLVCGDVVSTVIHHVPVRIVMIAEDACEVFYAASYAATLGDLWRTASSGPVRGE